MSDTKRPDTHQCDPERAAMRAGTPPPLPFPLRYQVGDQWHVANEPDIQDDFPLEAKHSPEDHWPPWNPPSPQPGPPPARLAYLVDGRLLLVVFAGGPEPAVAVTDLKGVVLLLWSHGYEAPHRLAEDMGLKSALPPLNLPEFKPLPQPNLPKIPALGGSALGGLENLLKQSELVPITAEDKRILIALAEAHPVTLTQDELEQHAGLSRRTINRRLKCLRQHKLTERPHGENSGEAITPLGRRHIAKHLDANAPGPARMPAPNVKDSR